MVVVKIIGGLGNQMFCYALYRSLKEKGIKTKVDISFYNKQDNQDIDKRELELEKVFGLKLDRINYLQSFLNDIEIRFGLKRVISDNMNGFQSEVMNIKDGVLSGYWQSLKYSNHISSILRNDFSFDRPLSDKAKQILEKIRKTNSVSISVRRGDYLKVGYVQPLEYYDKAISYIKTNVENPVFYCTSDDIEWCKNVWDDSMVYIDWLDDYNQYFGMQIISECKHNIISNSTYGFWGAWLNDNKNKIVIRPSKWFKDPQKKKIDFWPEEWLVIDKED